MSAARGDVDFVVDVMTRHRVYIAQLIRRAEDRRAMAISLSEREIRH